jgi:biotin carboxylase
LDTCAFHAEIYVTKHGPKLVEFAARLGGGHITSHLVPIAMGVNLTRAVIAMALGDTPPLTRTRSQGAAIRFLTPLPGRVTRIQGLSLARTMPGIVELACSLSPGSTVHRLENSNHRIGYVIGKGRDTTDAIAAANRAAETIRIDTEPIAPHRE